MKKFMILLLIAILSVCLFACGGQDAPAADAPDAPAADDAPAGSDDAATDEPDPYYFASGDVDIYIMSDADAVMKELGDPLNSFEADSCAFQGKDLFYYYDGFQLTVNDVDGVNKVTAITVMDDTVRCPQGLGIGSDEAKITEAFGEPASKTEQMYVYRHGTTCLQVTVKDGKVAAMVYAYSVEG
ncbi:MAG: hypothetical protein IJP03_05645 [Christensenellaceae bacterium]|nr:hypothetical protein [Christensenellaceae bacterium]